MRENRNFRQSVRKEVLFDDDGGYAVFLACRTVPRISGIRSAASGKTRKRALPGSGGIMPGHRHGLRRRGGIRVLRNGTSTYVLYADDS